MNGRYEAYIAHQALTISSILHERMLYSERLIACYEGLINSMNIMNKYFKIIYNHDWKIVNGKDQTATKSNLNLTFIVINLVL